MKVTDNRVTLLQIPLIEEKYGRSAMVSLAVHVAALLVLIFGVKLFPQTVIQLGSGQGGGFGGADIATVGVVDQFSGGAGMVKPSMIPQPPALVPTPVKEQPKPKQVEDTAIPIPEKIEQSKPTPKIETKPVSDPKPESKPVAKSTAKPNEPAQPIGNAIPVPARPGSGGVAGTGSGGGSGGGTGISVGTGSGGIGDSWYAQVVERRISERWIRPPEGMRIDMTYSFYINPDGVIYNIKKENSSGNSQIDLTALRAINAANPLSKPPREFQGKAIQFVARFVHPPDSADE